MAGWWHGSIRMNLIVAAVLALLVAFPQATLPMATKVESIRHHATAENTRVVFDLSRW